MQVRIADIRKIELIGILDIYKKKTFIKIRNLAQLIGKLVAAFPGGNVWSIEL